MSQNPEIANKATAEVEDARVCVGCIDFLTIRLGQELVADNVLDSYSQTAEEFSPGFDGDWLDDDVQEFDATPINYVVVVLHAEVVPPLRGHQLGAWMLTEIAYRMLSSHDGLIVLSPTPDDADPTSLAGQRATRRLSGYWRSCGLVPIPTHPGFLAQASAYTALGAARRALTSVADHQITLTAAELARWSQPFGSHDEWS
ncbi:hypothetical protein [Nocardia lijiangensis]|uniref:hypothetical protein n=1 Tax=Nocardia lijiangensis TaxID=299618 RepID=UPI0008330FD9|nr:hypothetical protein [Nocardia lijiangensis]